MRHGLKKCGHCRQQFTARVGTVFESSHIPLHKWFQACHLLCASKKGISSHQLHRVLCLSYKAAWFMSHRLREAMRTGARSPMGGNFGVVEVDETIFGRAATHPKGRRIPSKKITQLSPQEYGLAYSGRHFGDRITIVTERLLDARVNPHLFRDCAATTIATADPKHVSMIASLLGHSNGRTGEAYYNQAKASKRPKRAMQTSASCAFYIDRFALKTRLTGEG